MQITITITATYLYLGQTKSRQPLYVSSGLFSMFYSKQTQNAMLASFSLNSSGCFAQKCRASPFSSKNSLPSSARQSTWGQGNLRPIYARWKGLFSKFEFQHRPPLIHPPSWKQDFPVVFLPFPFPSPPAPAARVTRRRLGTSQLLALVAPHNALTHKLFILQDRYADSKAVPPVDDQQDYELTNFQESDGKTLLKFKRKFDTCDPRDRKLEVSISAHHFLLNEMPPQVYRCYSSALHFPPSFQPFLSHSHYS